MVPLCTQDCLHPLCHSVLWVYLYPCQIEPFAPKQRDLKIRSIVKFPYLLYVTIICDLLLIVDCIIKADTTALVGALFIFGDRVKFIPIYLVPFESHYSQRWCAGQQVQLLFNSLVTREMVLQPTAESPHVFLLNPDFGLLWVFEA